MNTAGARILLRLALKRDRVMLPAWVLALSAGVAVTASSYSTLYATEASRREVVVTLGTTPATLALYGRIYSDSVAGLIAWRLGGILLALVGLMGILLVVRHTRADEETGRAELLGAGVVGRHAPLAAALIVAGAASAAVGILATLTLLAAGLPTAGSIALGLAIAAAGCVFATTAAVAAQVAETSRAANGIAIATLAAAFATRAIGDAGPHWLSWLSPLGWSQQVRAFGGDRWWVYLPLAALIAALAATAVRLTARRDLGAGLLPPRVGPERGALKTPLALAWRLQRGALAGWAAGFVIVGAASGSIAQDIGNVIGNSPSVRDALQKLGGQQSLVDAYLTATLQLMALAAAAFAVQSMLRLRGEETGGRAEPLLATAVSRTSWALSHAAIALAGAAVLLAAAGLAAGTAHALQTGDAAELPRVLAAALAQVPAAWVLAGIALALFGLAPRAAAAGWGVLAACLALGQLGPVVGLPKWAVGLSPFAHSPRLPGGAVDTAPLWLIAVAAAFATAGLTGLKRRDVT